VILFPQFLELPMLRKSLHRAAFFAAILLAFPASHAAQDTSRQPRPNLSNGIAISDVPGAPFSATVVLESERIWPDGSSELRRTINLIARDSQGRTHNETRRLMPEYFHGSPELTSVRLFDPLTRIRTICEPALHIARQQFVPKQPKTAALPNPSVRIEDLGTTTLNGLQARGTRRTKTIPDYESNDNGTIEIEDEIWYSEDLHLNLLVRHSDSRIGVETVGVSDLKRIEPPASMFRVPPGYRIQDSTPARPPANPAPPKPSDDASDLEPPS
jgi:hypothetical protein